MVILKSPRVFLLAGTEQFLKEESLAKIKSAFLDTGYADFNFHIFYAGSTPIEKILECVSTAPFLGQKRVVLVRQIENLSVSEEKLILSYLKSPHKQTILVLETSQTNLNQNFFTQVCQYARVIFCKPLTEHRLSAWIKAKVKQSGKDIEKKALQLLINNLGSNLGLLATSLDSLLLYIGEKATIQAPDVEKLVGLDLDTSAFELASSVIARDKEKSLQILDSLLKDGINSSQILGALAHKMISEKEGIDSGIFEQYLWELQNTDRDIKTGRQNQRIALELLMTKLLDFS